MERSIAYLNGSSVTLVWDDASLNLLSAEITVQPGARLESTIGRGGNVQPVKLEPGTYTVDLTSLNTRWVRVVTPDGESLELPGNLRFSFSEGRSQ